MGRETTLQAFPSEWLQQATNPNESVGDQVQSIFCFLAWLRRKQPNTVAAKYFASEHDTNQTEIFSQVLDLLNANPSLLWRYADLDRRFEVLMHLLASTDFSSEQKEVFRFAISGRNEIHPSATGGQGFPIKLNDMETTIQVNNALAAVEFGDLAEHFGTEHFMRQTLYKKSVDRNELTYLHQYFCQLKEFYRAAAAAGNVTVVLVD
jgi:hypothetical protein